PVPPARPCERDRALAAVTGMALYALFASAVLEAAWGAPPARLGTLDGAAGSLFWSGAPLRCAALRELGGFFLAGAVVVPGQPLVTTGVYRLVRHPSEAGLLAIGIATIALLHSAIAFAIWALFMLPASIARIRREDALLDRAFPIAHARYAARVGALIPRPA